ncbi:thioredoxin family protein [Adhaeribacter soli]|uniref:Thioredoxin family protein n=1 Tax=Adhaeribacter soli TaxID=2607655 RepID=A0A5N1J3H7_9BACT|nr:thioredoxin family protein [Adhaeribacter soli]KAA9340306.1 thioredoxin family protein [Adhaeribacter soli]
MPIQKATDTELRSLIFENARVVVKFTKTDCPVCERMGQTFRKLSEDARYQDVKFLLMDAAENPVSSKEVHLSGTPFFAVYLGGILIQCKLVAEENELEELLAELHKV